MSALIDDLRAALTEAAKTPLGQKALHGHDEDFDLEVRGAGTCHVTIAGGGFRLEEGPAPHPAPLRYTLVQADEATLRAILAGDISPVDAMEAGRLFLRTRLYGGGLITMLLRAAYDLARERKLAPAGGAG